MLACGRLHCNHNCRTANRIAIKVAAIIQSASVRHRLLRPSARPIAAIVSGIFHLIRAFDRAAPHRAWLGISGLAFIALGVVLIRHLHLTLAVIALLVGLSWIVQGVDPQPNTGLT